MSSFNRRHNGRPGHHPPHLHTLLTSIRTTWHHRTNKRNPAREGSKWRYYAVKNGLEGDDVYLSWHQAYPYCWGPATEYFFPGSLCKGFDETIDTYDYNTIIKPSSRSQIPMKVQLQTSSTDNTISTDSANPTPFLSAASNKALPKYSAKPKNDINKFIYNFESF